MTDRRKLILNIGILAIFHMVGVAGFLSPFREIFLTLTPYHLLFVFGYLLSFQHSWSRQFLYFSLSIMITSYLIELIGVQTGLVFGSYSYGAALGFKIGGTPLLIGVLWFVLIYGIGSQLTAWQISPVLKAATGACMMLLIDLFIEPVAMELGFWSWENDTIPIQNYVAWYMISFVYLLIYFKSTQPLNRIAPAIYWLQLGFFVIINLFVRVF